MKTLVAGASHKPQRYSHLAVNLLRDYGHEVVALGRRARSDGPWPILSGQPALSNIHTITLYLNAQNQRGFYDYFESLRPQRVIFNPGAENPEWEERLRQQNVEVLRACTLVMLRTGQY